MSASKTECEGYRCPECGYVHENAVSSVNAHVEAGDYCPKCGTQFDDSDRCTRRSGELWPWEKGAATDPNTGDSE